MKKLLWLDDYRNPMERDWLGYSPIPHPFETIWVKTYEEFVDWITKNGLPDGICFDHDLADEHYRVSMYNPDKHYNDYYTDGTFKEKTGYDAAKWLVEYCLDRNISLPICNVHTMNPIGKENILFILRQYEMYFDDDM